MKTTYKRKTQVYTFHYYRKGTSEALRKLAGSLVQTDATLITDNYKSVVVNKRSYTMKNRWKIGQELCEC